MTLRLKFLSEYRIGNASPESTHSFHKCRLVRIKAMFSACTWIILIRDHVKF